MSRVRFVTHLSGPDTPRISKCSGVAYDEIGFVEREFSYHTVMTLTSGSYQVRVTHAFWRKLNFALV
jgi:hypothetical protein